VARVRAPSEALTASFGSRRRRIGGYRGHPRAAVPCETPGTAAVSRTPRPSGLRRHRSGRPEPSSQRRRAASESRNPRQRPRSVVRRRRPNRQWSTQHVLKRCDSREVARPPGTRTPRPLMGYRLTMQCRRQRLLAPRHAADEVLRSGRGIEGSELPPADPARPVHLALLNPGAQLRAHTARQVNGKTTPGRKRRKARVVAHSEEKTEGRVVGLVVQRPQIHGSHPWLAVVVIGAGAGMTKLDPGLYGARHY
jgi:hypothetical protein